MAIAFVQGNAGGAVGSSTTVAVTLVSTVGSGNLVCGMVCWDASGSITLSNVKDDKNNTYTILDTVTVNPGVDTEGCTTFYLPNITNAPITLTATFSGAGAPFRTILADEFSGLVTVSPVDGAAHKVVAQTAIGTGTDAITTGNVTTTADGDLIYGVTADVGANNGIPAHGTGFTDTGTTLSVASLQDMRSEYRVQSSHGAIAGTFTGTQTGNSDFGTGVMAFKAAAVADVLMGQAIF